MSKALLSRVRRYFLDLSGSCVGVQDCSVRIGAQREETDRNRMTTLALVLLVLAFTSASATREYIWHHWQPVYGQTHRVLLFCILKKKLTKDDFSLLFYSAWIPIIRSSHYVLQSKKLNNFSTYTFHHQLFFILLQLYKSYLILK